MALAQSISGCPEAPVMDMTRSRKMGGTGVMAFGDWGHLLSLAGTRDVPTSGARDVPKEPACSLS